MSDLALLLAMMGTLSGFAVGVGIGYGIRHAQSALRRAWAKRRAGL